MPPRRLQLKLVAPSATPEEAAAIVAALERFMRATAPPPAAARTDLDDWRLAALEEDVAALEPDPWINA